MNGQASPPPRPATWKLLAAFAVIYFVWGSTFLAIRIGVHQAPPFLFAAMRFFAAGILLFGWIWIKLRIGPRCKREPLPTRREWLSLFLLAFLIFVADYGLLFWAEQRVPSGIAAVIRATVPAFTAVAEILILQTRKLTVRLSIALTTGLAGVAILTLHSIGLGGAPVDPLGACALVVTAIAWSIAAALTRKLPLPSSKLTSSAVQMTLGGLMLFLASAARGEFRSFHPAAVSAAGWWSLLYLIFAGSILGFTAYLWLVHHESPTKVSTYAYVNPVVAVILGYFFAGEALGARDILGAALVIVGVVILTTAPAVTTRRLG